MTVDTMEDVVEGSGVELSADEQAHIEYLREKNISAKEVSVRIEAARNRSAPSPAPAARPAPTEQMVSMTEVRKMFTEHGQKAEQTARAREVQKDIKGAIGKIVDDSGLTKKSRRRNRVVDDVFQALCGREDVGKLTDEDFQKVLIDETKNMIAEEREDDGTPPPSSTTPSSENDGGRKTAAEAMGQTNGNEPPPKSAARTGRPDPGRKFDVKNPRFGLDIEHRSDQAIQRDSSREAREFLRDKRKKQ